jgi:hypothetical protein
MKFSQAISWVKWLLMLISLSAPQGRVQRWSSKHWFFSLFNHLTQLIAWENFINLTWIYKELPSMSVIAFHEATQLLWDIFWEKLVLQIYTKPCAWELILIYISLTTLSTNWGESCAVVVFISCSICMNCQLLFHLYELLKFGIVNTVKVMKQIKLWVTLVYQHCLHTKECGFVVNMSLFCVVFYACPFVYFKIKKAKVKLSLYFNWAPCHEVVLGE